MDSRILFALSAFFFTFAAFCFFMAAITGDANGAEQEPEPWVCMFASDRDECQPDEADEDAPDIAEIFDVLINGRRETPDGNTADGDNDER